MQFNGSDQLPASETYEVNQKMTPKKLLLAFVLICLSAGLFSCKPSPLKGSHGKKAAINTTETKLASIPQEYVLRGVEISPRGNNAAYYAATPDKKVVMMIRDRQIGVYDSVKDLKFSPDELDVAYIVRKNRKEYLILNGKTAGKGYDTVDNPVFSPDGGLVAYEASEKGKYFIVLGDRESEHYDMSSMPPVFSGDGKRVFYILQDYSGKKVIVFICEVPSGRVITTASYDAVGVVALSADGKRFAFPAVVQGRYHLVQGEFSTGEIKSGASHDLVDNVALSRDGSMAGYLTEHKGKLILIIGEKSWRLDKGQEVFGPPVFSGNSPRAAWVVVRNGTKQVVVDGVTGPAYDDVSLPVFSPDGSQVSYSARKGGKHHLVVGDREGPDFDMVVPPVFSPDGSRLAYRVRDRNQRFIVLADAEAKTVKQLPPYEAVWQPVFTPDGKLLAYGVGTLPVKELWWKVERVEQATR